MPLRRQIAGLRMSPGKVSIRQWSRKSLWMFREYNEMPHIFENRMQQAHPLAQAYVDQFPNRLLSVIARYGSNPLSRAWRGCNVRPAARR